MNPDLVPLSTLPIDQIVALNNDHSTELSYASTAKLQQLATTAYFACGISDASAFLISFDQSATYESENFLWFKQRYKRFVYIDRVVVAPEARGRGYARLLYESLFAKARADRFAQIVCEVNSAPPNPGSDSFHAALGFVQVGAQALIAHNKSVRYLLKDI